MKILCLIDHLGSGGSQRQIVSLATLLDKHGFNVVILTYYPYDFFKELLKYSNIKYLCLEIKKPLERLIKFRNKILDINPDIIISFLNTPNLIAELSSIPHKKWGLIVSERSAVKDNDFFTKYVRRVFHTIADYVVTNSHTNRLLIGKDAPWLKNKTVTIYNTVDLKTFSPNWNQKNRELKNKINTVVVSRFKKPKNTLGLFKAIKLMLEQEPNIDFHLSWYGSNTGLEESAVYSVAIEYINKNNLNKYISLHPPLQSVEYIYKSASCLLLPSFYEGLPNVVIEAMACGCPVLISDVCDAGNLVSDGENGFLFNPKSSEDIANKIVSFIKLSYEDRLRMGQSARKKVVSLFSDIHHITAYINLITNIKNGTRNRIYHYPENVPLSAIRYSE